MSLGVSDTPQKFTLKFLVAQIARCNRDMQCDSNRTPPNRWRCEKVISLAMRKTHSLDLKSQENAALNARKKSQRRSCDVGLGCEKSACFLRSSDAKCLRFGLRLQFGLRCEHSRCQIASDVGRAIMRTTKFTPKIHAQDCWQSLRFLNSKMFHADFLLAGRSILPPHAMSQT